MENKDMLMQQEEFSIDLSDMVSTKSSV